MKSKSIFIPFKLGISDYIKNHLNSYSFQEDFLLNTAFKRPEDTPCDAIDECAQEARFTVAR